MIKVIGMLLVCIGAALAAAFGVFLLQDSQGAARPAATEFREGEVGPEGAAVTSSDVADLSLAKSARTMTEQEREVLIEQIRTQLDALMKDYENHIRDREKREVLKQEIDILVTKYNELILPVALTEVKKQSVGAR